MCMKKFRKYQQKLHMVAQSYTKSLAHNQEQDVFLLQNLNEQQEKFCADVSCRQKQLDDVTKKWRTFDSLMESVTTWMQKAESLIKEGGINSCKVSCLSLPLEHVQSYVIFG